MNAFDVLTALKVHICTVEKRSSIRRRVSAGVLWHHWLQSQTLMDVRLWRKMWQTHDQHQCQTLINCPMRRFSKHCSMITPPTPEKKKWKRGEKKQRNYRWQENRPCLSSLFLINSSSLPALRSTVINVMERGRGAYISLCISVMYMGEIRGEGAREGVRERESERHENYPFLLRHVHCGRDNLNEKIWDEGGES